MRKYVNGGIVKEMTVYMQSSGDFNKIINKISKFIDLNLYDMKIYNNAIYFDLNDDFIKSNLAFFLKEISSMNLPSFINYPNRIRYIEENIDKSLKRLIEECDDVFEERFRSHDVFSINDGSFYLDVVCYIFYFEGPYDTGYFDGLLQYLHLLHKMALKNPLKDVLCFGISS